MEGDDNWMPLESNPEVINSYIQGLGFDTTKYALTDLLSTDDWAQEMVPNPVLAVFFLYPISEKQEKYRDEEAERLEENPQTISPNVFFMEQHAANACGTIAALHSIANIHRLQPDLVAKGSFLAKFIEATKNLSPEERGAYLKGNKDLEEAHKEAVQQGESEVEDSVMTHFIAFMEIDGHLYELDGTKDAPVDHGEVKPENLLSKSCEIIKQFMERDPEEIRFTLMALAKAGEPQSE